MKLTTPVLATALAAPSLIDAWSPRFSLTTRSPLDDLWSLSPRSILRQQEALLDRGAFQQASPRYKITENDEQIEIALDVPGLKPEDIKVNFDDDSQLLSINGERQASGDNYKFSSKFSQSFYLGSDVELDKFTANLEDGVLVVTAPKDLKKLEEGTRSIPIMQAEAKKEELKLEEEKPEETDVLDAETEAVEEKEPAAV